MTSDKTTKLGIIYDDRARIFLAELLADWECHFTVDEFSYKPIEFPFAKGRINPVVHWFLLRRFMRQHDIVFFEWVGENLVLASKMPHTAKIVARLHSWELFHHAKDVNWHNVDSIVLVSRAMQDRFLAMYPGHVEKTVVLPSGKSLTRFTPREHPFSGKIAMLGNILPIKRVYEMILALAELRRSGLDLSLHIAGKLDDEFNNQRYYASVQELITKLQLTAYITFYGWVDAAEWLPDMDMFVSNSFWEGQQNALIEAMAAGCYCLSHFWNGAEEILPSEYLFSTEAELVQKIRAYIQMPDVEQQQLCQQLRSIVAEKFDLQDSVIHYRDLIQKLGNDC
ncbi:MAG: glycosyltransferase family 4 protein [Anaerolineae bacterium]|nr:glycosyltransferase family 4 protein [Anaerolineae bacterium]